MDRFRYVARLSGKEELYDLTRDLGEYFNVADDPAFASALSEMRAELIRRLLQIERPIPRTWPY